MKMLAHIDLPYEKIATICQHYPIRRLALFGSVLRDDFQPESDVDMLVEFEVGAVVDLFDMAEIEDGLTQLLGRKVDLRTPKELSRYFRDQVVATAQTVYERE
ncbi:MAG: nucleotidyltransferase [Chloroflexi bacterium CFX4]|nr:nucleotidyltransferase [Chloroflexi bacterium CFX4]MDL1923528.1 nucleotidyltransferase family protein [Chloroflexi bacterium CFX3]